MEFIFISEHSNKQLGYKNLSFCNGCSHSDKYNKDGTVHYILQWFTVRNQNKYVLQSLRTVFSLANSGDTDEMQHCFTFHLGDFTVCKVPI